MKVNNFLTTTGNIINTFFKSNLLIKTAVTLVMMFIIIQLYVLTTVGTQGERVSELRREQASVKVQNDILQADILKLQSSASIKSTVQDNLQMHESNVTYISDTTINTVAASK